MTKYSTDQSKPTRWERDRKYVLQEWSTKPFVGIGHRHETVEQRIVIEYTHGIGVDIRHEARSDDTEKLPNEWTAVESIEVREYGATHDRRPERRWVE